MPTVKVPGLGIVAGVPLVDAGGGMPLGRVELRLQHKVRPYLVSHWETRSLGIGVAQLGPHCLIESRLADLEHL